MPKLGNKTATPYQNIPSLGVLPFADKANQNEYSEISFLELGKLMKLYSGEDSVQRLSADNATVYADGAQGTPDPTGTYVGWHYKNPADVTNKVNWYFAGSNAQEVIRVGTLSSIHAVITSQTANAPYIVFYTAPEGDGNDETPWYRSRFVYYYDGTLTPDQTTLMYKGVDPDGFATLPRAELELDPLTSVGPQGALEVVTAVAFSTSTNYSEGYYDFVVEELGYKNLANLTGYTTHYQLDFVDTSGVIAPSSTYTNTHYVDLDATNDYIELASSGTLHAPDISGSDEWAVGFEIEDVSSVNDSSFTTLFSSGNTSVTLRKGGSNWGIYVFVGSSSAAQANTWYAPAAGSKVLIQFTGTKIEYWLNGVRRANMTPYSSVASGSSPTAGELNIGKGGQPTVYGTLGYWYGGLNNLMVSNEKLGTDAITAYFATQDVSEQDIFTSTDFVDFLPLGENTYPDTDGLKGVLTGELKNGTEADFVER